MARPTKLTAAVRKAICDAVREGASFEGACEAAGISVSTGHEWYSRGTGRDREAGRRRRRVRSLRRSYARARKLELREVKQIVAASKEDWRAAAWLLERR